MVRFGGSVWREQILTAGGDGGKHSIALGKCLQAQGRAWPASRPSKHAPPWLAAPRPPRIAPQCKTRQVSIFRHGIFRNPVTLFGVVISLATILVVTYVPFLQVCGCGPCALWCIALWGQGPGCS